jgi:predicted permease
MTALRSLLRSPGFFLTAVLSLGLGLGAGAAAFSVIDAVRFRALPFPDGDRLVVLSEIPANPVDRSAVSCYTLCDVSYETFTKVLQAGTFRTIDAVAGFTSGGKALNLGGEPILVTGGVVSPNLFTLLGVKPMMGRLLTEEDNRLGVSPMVLISHDMWTEHLARDPNVVGRVIKLSDTHYTIVGVMPPGFNHEVRNTFWLPAVPTLDPSTRPSIRSLTVIARLAPGRTLAQFRAELATIDPALLQSVQAGARTTMTLAAEPLRTRYSESTGSHDLIFAAIVGCILLIAVANLANLVLVRTLHMQREFAVRSALGARAGRQLRELLTQHTILVIVAALVGLLLASWLLKVLGTIDSLTSIRPSGMEYRLDWRSISFVTLLALAVGALLSLVPSRVVSRSDVQQVLRAGAPNAGGSSGGIAQKIFVVAQVAVAVVLLTGAGLMGRTVWRLANLDLGFNPAPLLSGSPSFPHPWRVREKFVPVTRQIANDLALLPGATSVAIRANAPLGPRGATPKITLEGQAEPLPAGVVPQNGYAVSAGYFRAMGIQVKRGREFDGRDLENTMPVALVNDYAANRWWPGQDPVGRIVRVDTAEAKAPLVLTIVGVVADNRAASPNLLLSDPGAEVYLAYEQAPSAFPTFLIRADQGPQPLLKPVRETLARLVPDRPLFASLASDNVSDQLGGVRVNAYQVLGFAVVGFGLALMGIYGVLSYAVGRRTQEIGIRGALGASRGRLTRMVLLDAGRLVGIGLVVGVLLSFAATNLISSMLYGTNRTDPLVYAGVIALVVAVSFAASWLPARRASKVDPLVALRNG